MSNNTERLSFLKHQARHVRQCRREALVVLVIMTVALGVSSTILYSQGYLAPDQRPAQPVLILGIPSWVMWGLVIPWLATIVVTWLFALFVMKDDEPYVEVPDALRQRDSNSVVPN